MEEAGFALPVIEAHCDYRQPARYDDELDIETTGSLLSPVRVRFDYEVVRAADGMLLADRTHRPRLARSAAAATAGWPASPRARVSAGESIQGALS